VSGDSSGVLSVFENAGTAAVPDFVELTGTASPFHGLDLGAISTPAFADLDGDGDVDLLAGSSTGTLRTFRAGWDETEKLTLASAWRTLRAAFFGEVYEYSPMSSLHVYGRSQDVGFQKARDTIHERRHLRIWLSDMKFRGEHVWVGTITRDIGVYFTPRAWNLATHAIDPAVDEVRHYVREDFQVSPVGRALGPRPRRRLRERRRSAPQPDERTLVDRRSPARRRALEALDSDAGAGVLLLGLERRRQIGRGFQPGAAGALGVKRKPARPSRGRAGDVSLGA